MTPADAIAWYRENREKCPQQPFGIYQLERGRRMENGKHVEYSKLRQYATVADPRRFYESLEQSIAAFEAGQLNAGLARAYVLRPVAQLRSAMKHDLQHKERGEV